MISNDKRKFKCPSCAILKNINEVSITINLIKELREKKALTYYINVGNDFFDQIPINEFEWACNECFGKSKAISTNTSKQKYLDHRPYLAYFDSIRKCEKCTDKYVFTKEEKHFWYEELNFWVQSKPIHCLNCRKEKRAYKRLSKLLKNGEKNLSDNELVEIIEIYQKLARIEKMKYFQSILKKRKK